MREKRNKGGRKGKEQRGGRRASACRVEGNRDRRFGGTSYKRNCHRERCGSGGSSAAPLGSRAQLAGGSYPAGGIGWGRRLGHGERLAKWHRAPKPLGSLREGSATGCALGLWRLPILRAWPALPRTLPIDLTVHCFLCHSRDQKFSLRGMMLLVLRFPSKRLRSPLGSKVIH